MNTITADVSKSTNERSKVIITVKREFGTKDFYKLYAEYAAVKMKQGSDHSASARSLRDTAAMSLILMIR